VPVFVNHSVVLPALSEVEGSKAKDLHFRSQIWPKSTPLLRTPRLFYKIGVMTTPTVGSLELAALLAVVRLGDEAYGLAVRQDLVERSGKDHSVGAIYTTLQRLEDKGLLTSRASEPLPVRGGRSRRHFRVTGAGARAIKEAERQSASMWAGVGTPSRLRPA
jgi:PadR family transcriptional regulator, regulatory protein PadR